MNLFHTFAAHCIEHLLPICGQRKMNEHGFYPFVPLLENAHAPKWRNLKLEVLIFPVSTGSFLTSNCCIRSANFAHQKNATFNHNKTIIMCYLPHRRSFAANVQFQDSFYLRIKKNNIKSF
jgi:hypothetical protein